MKSTMFKLNKRDFKKSLIMGLGTPLIYYLQGLIPGLDLPPEVKLGLSAILI